MNNKFAFKIIKILEKLALSRLEKLEGINNNRFSLILMLPSSSFNNKSEWTLVLKGNNSWLEKAGRKETIREILLEFREKKISDFDSSNLINRISLLGYKDENFNELNRILEVSRDSSNYFKDFFNIEINNELITEGYILKSKILDKIEFGKEIQIVERVKENPSDSNYEKKIKKYVITGVENYDLIVIDKDNKKKKVSLYNILNILDEDTLMRNY